MSGLVAAIVPGPLAAQAARPDSAGSWTLPTLVAGLVLAFVVTLVLVVRRERRARAGLGNSERLFRAIVESAPDAIAVFDADAGHFVNANPAAVELMGLRWDGGPAPTLDDLSPAAVDATGTTDDLRARVREALAGKTPLFEWVFQRPGRDPVPTEIRLARLPSEEGNLVRISALDVRERRDAERQHELLEEQLRQSQKIEALGQLTGGVAHDFNNLLTVISGNLELLLDSRGDDEEVQELATVALEAADRSALLTSRLLSFSRRQALDARAVDLPSLVKGLLELLRRSLGETVEIVTRFEKGLARAHVDPSQLEHAIINLAVNARDAMSGGGRLVIEAVNASLDPQDAEARGARHGDLVILSVTDDGAGMTEQVRSRAFDPFFTTKDVGRGSGLGLSMVYGFVRQSGGFIEIHSQEGEGTTFAIYLPRATTAVPEPDTEDEARVLARGDGETILIVEDDPRVLDFVLRLCDRLGYRTVAASDAREAIAVLQGDQHVDLVFSDMILPGGANGVELAQRARTIRPDLPILLTSGYGDQSILDLQNSLPGVGMVTKPFDTMTLATSLRAALGH